MWKSLAIVITFTLPLPAATRLLHFSNPECGYSFSYPSGWRVSKERCTVTLRLPDHADVDTITIWSGSSGGFDAGAGAAGFYKPRKGDPDLSLTEEKHAGEWLLRGEVPVVADELQQGEARGLQAEASTRCHDSQGRYAGQCEMFAAFLSRDGRWIAAEGNPEEVILTVLRSAIFH